MVQRHCDVTSEGPTLGLGSYWDVGSQGRLGLHLHREPYSLLEVIWGYFFFIPPSTALWPRAYLSCLYLPSLLSLLLSPAPFSPLPSSRLLAALLL